jgi:hypothetical protein
MLRPTRLASLRPVTAAAWLTFAAAPVLAQEPPVPTFKFEKAPPKPVDWKVQAKGGALVTRGNSDSQTGVLSVNGSRQVTENKISLEGRIAYGRSNIVVPVITPDTTTMPATNRLTGLDRRAETTTNEWLGRGRYDRFLTTNNAAYVLGQIAADRVAGKKLFGGGQVGYSRQLWKDDRHTTVAELGYDFSYESYIRQPGKAQDAVQIHSARAFVGELWSLTSDTGINLSAEALFNLNEENALDASDETAMKVGVPAFQDIRLVTKLGLTTTLRSNLSFGFGITVRYDQNPALRPLPAAAKGLMIDPNARINRFAKTTDVLSEATLVFTFL